MPPDLIVEKLSEASFFRAIGDGEIDARTLPRATYLFNYLKAIKAGTLVVEAGYIDGDYLEDFATYYVRCFKQYASRCRRLHFFEGEWSQEVIEAIALGDDANLERFQQSYRGFIVRRPLPEAIIGRTQLATYEADNGRRRYTAVRTYHAHLLGIQLSIKSLPFQEQDTVTAACATVAIWSALNQVSGMFGTPAPRPALITRSAASVQRAGRPIPSHGLNVEQICSAVTASGLEPEVFNVTPETPLPSLLYAYLSYRVPVVLGVEVEGRGLHAVTLAGYSLLDKRHLTTETGPSVKYHNMIGLRINEFYAHDDQIGPFSRLNVKPSFSSATGRTFPITLEGSWTDPVANKQLALYPFVVIIPVYHKIRVTFLDVQKWISRISRVSVLVVTDQSLYEWDTRLTDTNRVKVWARSVGSGRSWQRQLILDQHPRFMWQATLRVAGTDCLDLLIDATDMARSFSIYRLIWRDQAFGTRFLQILNTPNIAVLLEQFLTQRLVELMRATPL
jgi:hypothetical protein